MSDFTAGTQKGVTYDYIVRLELFNEQAREAIKLTDLKSQIEQGIDKYHNLDTVRHKKTLSPVLFDKILEMHICSPVPLEVPSKSISKFTRLLLEDFPDIFGEITNGRVFRSVESLVPAAAIDSYSNSETLKRLVDIFCDNDTEDIPKFNEKIELQRKIKLLIFNSK